TRSVQRFLISHLLTAPFQTGRWRNVGHRSPSAEPRLGEHVPAVEAAQVGRRQAARLVALLARAAREVEIALEIAPLADDLGVPQDEVVRVEEPPEIDVGEDPRRRRTALPL